MENEFKLEINGTEYELEQAGVGSNIVMPFVIFNGRNYIGKAIPKQASKLPVRDYEILEYINPHIISDIPNANIVKSNHFDWSIADIRSYPIQSVKRNDGEVFNVKDNTDDGIIEKFEISNNKCYLYCRDSDGRLNECNITCSSKVKQPIPLFRTRNMFDIYSGDVYYKVWDNWTYTKYYADKGGKYPSEYIGTTFSNEDDAIEYILMNKPCLSVQDILSVSKDEYGHGFLRNHRDRIKELAKSKLNQ